LPEAAFDDLGRLAADFVDTDIALITRSEGRRVAPTGSGRRDAGGSYEPAISGAS
jgi:hypothetical protein